MMLDHPGRLLAIAIFLLLFGCITLSLMVVQVVASSFFLNFLSFGASVSGLFWVLLGLPPCSVLRPGKKKKGIFTSRPDLQIYKNALYDDPTRGAFFF
jgi:hypothetical protein